MVKDEIMIQIIIVSNLVMRIYPCAMFKAEFEEIVLLLTFVGFEVIPLLCILHMLFKELGVTLFNFRYFEEKQAGTGATAMLESDFSDSDSDEF